ncbi:hypothetical protein Tco_1275334 [Tanacetum coccineum]
MYPYLVTLVMEVLSLIVQDKVERNDEFEYHFACNQLKLTHLCFVDDLLMFCHGDKTSVSILKEAIKEFVSISWLIPNYNKSTIIFGSMTLEDKHYILDCVSFKLIDFVLESIHVYWTFVFLLPHNVIHDINKLYKGFLWNLGKLSKGKAKVVWKSICIPKSQSGLGLKDIGIWNKAMIIKHLWHAVIEKDSLWVKWVNTVKLKGRSIWAINEEVYDSLGCKNILKLRNEVRNYITTILGDGANASVIYDIGVELLEEYVVKYLVLDMHQNVLLNIDRRDKIVRMTNDGKEV